MEASLTDTGPANLETLLHEAELAHGHLCAGQILGVRMAMLACRILEVHSPRLRSSPDRKRLVTFVEIDRCATDAIAVVTGCRVGKRALKLRDWGKMAATFVDLAAPLPDLAASPAAEGRSSALPETPQATPATLFRGLRLVARESSKERARELFPTHPDGRPFANKNEQQMRAYRDLSEADLFAAEWVSVSLPASEFPGYRGARVTCAACGEGINFDRFTLRSGAATDAPEPLCLACADLAARYYQPLSTPPPVF